MQKGVKYVLGGPRETTLGSGWRFQGGRIWNPPQKEIPTSQGGNGLPGKARSYLSREAGKRRPFSQWGDGGESSSKWGWPLGAGFHLIPARSHDSFPENRAELAQPHMPAGLTELLPNQAGRKAPLSYLHPQSERISSLLPIVRSPKQIKTSGVLALD